MNLEIIERRNDIRYEVPAVSFPAYEEYMDKARQIADYIASVEVSKDSIKDAKKTLADARKLTDRLNGLRIDMKKQILQNYSIVEAQIKEISEVVNEADADLRAKVRELDELEREANRVVWRNVPVTAQYPAPEELAGLDYRSKKEIEGDVRIVTIEGVDCCACCAPHVSRTGEIGQIRIVFSGYFFQLQNAVDGLFFFLSHLVRILREIQMSHKH